MFSSASTKAILNIVFIAILARLLMPDDFGLIATAMLIVKFAEMCATIGVGPALVQKKNITDKHISSAFTFVMILGLLLYGFFLLINPYLASFFNRYELLKILNLICIIIPFHMFSQVSYSLLQKNFKFKSLAGWDVLSYFIGYGMIGVPLAYSGLGVFSLVWAAIIQAVSYTLFLFLVYPETFKIKIYKKEIKELLFFGSGFTIAGFFNYFARNGDYFIISKFLGMEQLGLYSRAYTLMNAVDRILGMVMQKVMFPTFSEIQNNKNIVIKVLDRSLGLLLPMLIFASIYCYIYSEAIITIILGKKWLDVIIPFQILVLGMTFRVGYRLLASCIKGIGKVYQNSFLQFIYMLSVIIGSYLLKDSGIIGISIAVCFALFVHFLFQSIYLIKKGYLYKKTIFEKIFFCFPIISIIIVPLIIINNVFLNIVPPIYILLISILFIIFIFILLLKLDFKVFIPSDYIWLINKMKNNTK